MFTGPRRRWRSLTVYSVEEWSQGVSFSSGEIQGLGNRPFSYRYQPSYLKWELFFMLVERSRPSRLNSVQSAWGISTVSFISMPKPICRACEQKSSASSLTSSSSTPFKLSCLLRFQGCKDRFLKYAR